MYFTRYLLYFTLQALYRIQSGQVPVNNVNDAFAMHITIYSREAQLQANS